MNGRRKVRKVQPVPETSGHRKPHDRGVTSSVRRERATTNEVSNPMSVASSQPCIIDNASPWPDYLQMDGRVSDISPLQNIQQYDEDEQLDDEDEHVDGEVDSHPSRDSGHVLSIRRLQRGVRPASSYFRGPSGRFVSSREASYPEEAGGSKRKCTEDESWRVKGPMPGGPEDDSVIPSFGGHIALDIYDNKERAVLKCQNRKAYLRQLQEWGKEMSTNSNSVLENCKKSGLFHLADAMFCHLDMPLISAFVERWQPDTNTFHLPFGEMTILLHDVHHILRIPVDGLMVVADQDHDRVKQSLADLLSVSPEDLVKSPVSIYQGGGVLIRSLIEHCKSTSRAPAFQGAGFLLALLGCTLFVDKSGSRVRPTPLSLLLKPGELSKYSWGAAGLANLYRQLGRASRADTTGIAGCLTLLQAWIYEYFPVFRPSRPLKSIEVGWPRTLLWDVRCESKDLNRLQTIRRLIDDLQPTQIDWLPYRVNPIESLSRTLFMGNIRCFDIIEPYMPDRVVRQFGYIQSIPNPITIPDLANRPRDEKRYKVEFSVASTETAWRGFPRGYFLGVSGMDKAQEPGAVSDDYIEWFKSSSHPFVLPEDEAHVTKEYPSRVTSDHVLAGLMDDMKELMLCEDFDQIQPPQYRSGIRQAVSRLKAWNIVRGVCLPPSSQQQI